MVFLIGTAAAVCLALGYVLQQRTAARAASSVLSYRLLLWLIREPVWWIGIVAMILGELLGGLALRDASVALVEPLLSTSLLFAFGFAAYLSDRRVRWFEVGGAVLVSAALGVFIAIGNPRSSSHRDADRPYVALAVLLVAVAVALLVAVGKRQGLVGESILLATAAGLLYGLQDASTRAALVDFQKEGLRATLTSPWSYVVIASAAVGIALAQSAFKAARLDYSLPPIAVAEPVAGIALGIGLLGDHVSVSVAGLTVEALCLAAMVVGVVLIGRSSALSHC